MDSVEASRGIPKWPALALEIGVVVVGILIAFALNSWWGQHQARLREVALLVALRGDFEQNVQRLESLIEREDRIIASSQRLVALARAPRFSPDSARGLIAQVFSSDRFEPVMGAYEGVLGSGGLTQIGDDSLRIELADFAARVSVRYGEEYANQLYFQLIHDFSGRLGFPWVATAPGPPDTAKILPPRWDPGALLHDPSFQEQVAMRAFGERDMAAAYRGLLDRARRILKRLQAATGS